jgi:hypothetical protein
MSNNAVADDLDTFCEPQHGFAHLEVAAPEPRPWPRSERVIDPRIVGAGREMSMPEFL